MPSLISRLASPSPVSTVGRDRVDHAVHALDVPLAPFGVEGVDLLGQAEQLILDPQQRPARRGEVALDLPARHPLVDVGLEFLPRLLGALIEGVVDLLVEAGQPLLDLRPRRLEDLLDALRDGRARLGIGLLRRE